MLDLSQLSVYACVQHNPLVQVHMNMIAYEKYEEVNKFEILFIDKYLAFIILWSFYFWKEHILNHGFELHKIIKDLRLLVYGTNQEYPEKLTMKR